MITDIHQALLIIWRSVGGRGSLSSPSMSYTTCNYWSKFQDQTWRVSCNWKMSLSVHISSLVASRCAGHAAGNVRVSLCEIHGLLCRCHWIQSGKQAYADLAGNKEEYLKQHRAHILHFPWQQLDSWERVPDSMAKCEYYSWREALLAFVITSFLTKHASEQKLNEFVWSACHDMSLLQVRWSERCCYWQCL